MSDRAYVLDASALLAAMFGERGGEAVIPLLTQACISAVNVVEVATRLADRGTPADERRAILADLELDVRPLTAELALRAADLRDATRAAGLSLGDRCCLALAEALGAEAVTADAAWARGGHGVRVRLIR